jgi:hypothetical protein
MTAHVGDFGLLKFLSEASSQSSLSQTSAVGLKGTIGYAAPGTIKIWKDIHSIIYNLIN